MPSAPRLRLPVTLQIHPDARAEPPELFLGIARRGEMLTKRLKLYSGNGPLPTGSLGAVPAEPGMIVDLRQSEEGRAAELTMVVDTALLESGAHEAQVEVSVEGMSGGPLSVPYYLFVRDGDSTPTASARGPGVKNNGGDQG